MDKNIIIAIDGPSGVGKGTLAKSVADYFPLPYLDTGLLYRAVGRKMLDAGEKPDSKSVLAFAENLQEKDWLRNDLRIPEVDKAASQVAANPKIRAALLNVQRNFAMLRGGVMDGRDIGTVIFPSADFKFYLTASPRIRAERRWLQFANSLKAENKEQQINKIEMDLKTRDEMDSSREVAPLKPAEDAIVIDTDHLTALEVLEKVVNKVKRHNNC